MKSRSGYWLAALLLLLLLPAAHADPLDGVPQLSYTVRKRVAHDRTLFTQGMTFAGDTLVESGGGYRNSRLITRTLDDSTPGTSLALSRTWFAEGLAVQGGHLFLLTWQEGIAQQYSLPDLRPLQRFAYRGEGWGLTSDGRQLIQSDGSALLSWRDPVDFRVLRTLRVHANGEPVTQLNELEWVDGWIVANIWLSGWIVGIDPRSGEVAWKLDIGTLLSHREQRSADVPNGIAWHAPTRELWVSGKLWPWLYALDVAIPPIAPAAAGQ